jgi:hypothetical protein
MDRFFIWAEISVVLFAAWISVFWWFGKMPSIQTFRAFVDSLNTKGGNILILLFFAIIGAFATVRMFYYLVQLSVDGKLQQDNAYALMGLTFLTNQLTGAFVGALLKTMTGDVSQVENHIHSVQGKDNPEQGNQNNI